MTDAPEKIWFTKVESDIIPNSQRVSPKDVEYVRADMYDAAQSEIERLRSTIRRDVEFITEQSENLSKLRAEVAQLKAQAAVMDAWLAGEPSEPPRTGRDKAPVMEGKP